MWQRSGHGRLAATTIAFWSTRRARTRVKISGPRVSRRRTTAPVQYRVMAVTLKAALDGLLAQLALDPDLDAYRDELVALFDRATLPG